MFDAERLLETKQGQLETRPTHVTTRRLNHAVLIQKSVIDCINSHILDSAQKKISLLTEIKNFKKGIYRLEWENIGLGLKVI